MKPECPTCKWWNGTKCILTTGCQCEAATSATDTQVGGSHYREMKIQPIDYILANGIGFTEGNVIKYVSRWKAKNGVEDLKKARHFLDMLIEFEEQK